MKNNLPPPPPRRGGAASSSSGGGYTATTAPSTSASPYYSLSEIDDDDSTAAASASQQQQEEAHNNNNYNGGDDTTEIDDNDSILEMAKRLDAASVISDPSFIEGPHTTNEHYPSSRGAFNRKDDIASEEEEDEDDESSSSDSDDSSSSSSDSSTSSDGQYHHNHRERYDYNKSRSRESSNNRGVRYGTNNSRNYPEEGMRSHTKHHHHRGGGGGNNGRSSDRRRRDHPRQQQQSSSMPSSQPYYDNSYDGRVQHNNNNNNMSYPGAGERKYSPPRGVVGPTPIDPIMYTSNISNINNNNNNNGISKKQSRGGFRIDDPRSSSSNKNSSAYDKQTVAAYEKKQKQERYYDREDTESAKRRRTKMILIPTVVILIIGVVVAVAVVVGKGTGNDGTTTTTNNDNSNAFQPIPVPTTSPTYVGLYQCSFGKSGITVTKGCLGFIECSESGTPRGAIQYCTQGTLYDVQKGVCDFADNVVCSTSLPTQEDFAAGAVPPTTGGGGVVGVVPPAQNPPSSTVGPITTLDHKLLFEGILNPGQLDNNAMNRIAKNLEAYLNIFYSARVVSAYNNGDYVLESISNVAIEVTPTKFEFVQSNRRNLRRDLQTVAIQANGFAMTYQQSTKYDTIDRAITVGDVVRLPYQERYQDRIVSYLKAADPVFSSLTRALFVEGEIGGQPQPAPVPVSNPPPPTRKPTIAPTKQGVQVITPPTVAATNPDSSPSYMIQGLIFFDENQNGKFENETEKTFEGVWANLKLCTKNADGNDWVNTGASEAKGLYQFDDVKENEYFIEFFKPRPGDDYNFTAPQVAGTDDSVLDSDVIGFTKNGGKTGCFTVGPGFDSTKYINAGYKLKATPPPSPAPSKSPTQSPIDVSYYCADVTTTSAGTQTFNFLGCQIRCGNGFIECPGNTRCVFADVCIEPV